MPYELIGWMVVLLWSGRVVYTSYIGWGEINTHPINMLIAIVNVCGVFVALMASCSYPCVTLFIGKLAIVIVVVGFFLFLTLVISAMLNCI